MGAKVVKIPENYIKLLRNLTFKIL